MRTGRAKRAKHVVLAGVGVVALALSFVVAASARPRHAPAMPGPSARERGDDRIALNEDCVTCHDEIAQEWAGSLHARSFVDPMFQASIQRERSPEFCRSCHAPEADPRREPDSRRAQLGVSCVGCHVVGDEILAGPGDGRSERAPHGLRRELEFASSAACGGCHEFAFPKRGVHNAAPLMQQTMREHSRSAAHQTPCQDCHMPPTKKAPRSCAAGAEHDTNARERGQGVGVPEHDTNARERGQGVGVPGRALPDTGAGPATVPPSKPAELDMPSACPTLGEVHRGHGFAVASEPRMLRAAARIDAVREPGSLRVTLEPRLVGHAFPTGDLFRRLLVRVETDDGRLVEERYLARHFGAERFAEAGAMKVELSDDRVGVGFGPRVVEVPIPATLADESLRWIVRYQRVLETPAGAEHLAQVWDETELAVGLLPPSKAKESAP